MAIVKSEVWGRMEQNLEKQLTETTKLGFDLFKHLATLSTEPPRLFRRRPGLSQAAIGN